MSPRRDSFQRAISARVTPVCASTRPSTEDNAFWRARGAPPQTFSFHAPDVYRDAKHPLLWPAGLGPLPIVPRPSAATPRLRHQPAATLGQQRTDQPTPTSVGATGHNGPSANCTAALGQQSNDSPTPSLLGATGHCGPSANCAAAFGQRRTQPFHNNSTRARPGPPRGSPAP